MRTSRVVLAGIAVAAAAATTSAFTASNDVPDSVAGYGSGTVTGATVTDIHYTPKSSDPMHLDNVVFTTTTDMHTGSWTADMVLKKGDGTQLGQDSYSCTVDQAGWTGTSMTLTCSTTADYPLISQIGTVGLTVVQTSQPSA
jgi:hypothetical protein